MLLSERFLFNIADKYILQSAGFPLDRVAELDEIFMQMEDSLYIHVCTLAEPILLEREDYSALIFPLNKLTVIKEQIDLQFRDLNRDARQTFWSIVSQYLWSYSHQILSEIQNERRFNDPELGELFKLLKEAKKNGLFGEPNNLV